MTPEEAKRIETEQEQDPVAKQAMKQAEDLRRRRENLQSSDMDHYRPAGKQTLNDDGSLPEVFLNEVPQKLRSHPEQESSRVIMETRVI